MIGAVNVAAGCVSVCGAHSGAAGAAENAPQVPSHPPPHPGVPNTAKMILLGTVLALFFSGTFCDLFLTRREKAFWQTNIPVFVSATCALSRKLVGGEDGERKDNFTCSLSFCCKTSPLYCLFYVK